MKRLFVIIFIIVLPLFKSFSQNTWVWQNPLPQGNPIKDVYMFDANTAIVVGEGGVIMKTNDAGSSWEVQDSGVDNLLNSVHFINENIGWIVGDNNTILKTTDGGLNWITQETPIDSLDENFDFQDPSTWPSEYDYTLYSVYFIDDSTGWAVGRKQEFGFDLIFSEGIISTKNGGNTWIDQSTDTDATLYDVFFHDAQNGWTAGGNWNLARLLRTNNGGTSWTAHSGMPAYDGDAIELRSVYFVNENIGWIAGGNDLTMKTTNGGNSWQPIDWTWTSYETNPRSIFFTDEDNGWIVGKYILHTLDGGNQWEEQKKTPGGLILYYQSIWATDADHAFVVGPGSDIYQTNDSGDNWIKKTSGPTNDFYDVFFINTNTGWVVGEDYLLMKTTDGGTNWDSYYYNVDGLRFTSIHFFNKNIGWATGNMYEGAYLNGVVFKSEDEGYSWKPLTTFFRSTPQSIFFVDENMGWLVGDNALIQKTTDGGENWVSQDNPFSRTDQQFESVFFYDTNKGWIAGGNNGKILYTSNGGTSWSEQVSGTTEWLGSVFFLNADTGWCVGGNNFSSGIILNTTNGGESWGIQTDSLEFKLNSVIFADINRGWAAGNDGGIVKTIDGGTNWTQEQSNASNDLESICAWGENHLWTVGNGGTILHWFSGEENHAPEITSSDSVTTTEGSAFEYIAEANDPDGNTVSFSFYQYPTWLEANDSALVGNVPVDAEDTSFVVIASDEELSDTLIVVVTVLESSTVEGFDPNIPDDFCLNQNYPNPFNPQTTIMIGLPKATEITIQIYNLKGELVKEIFQGRKQAGYHSFVWDGSELSSGTYFIKMKAVNFKKTIKCLLLK